MHTAVFKISFDRGVLISANALQAKSSAAAYLMVASLMVVMSYPQGCWWWLFLPQLHLCPLQNPVVHQAGRNLEHVTGSGSMGPQDCMHKSLQASVWALQTIVWTKPEYHTFPLSCCTKRCMLGPCASEASRSPVVAACSTNAFV